MVNYGQFLQMMPEAILVLSLILLFIVDFCMLKSANKSKVLGYLAVASLLVLTCYTLFCNEPTSAFGGLYVTSRLANVMKCILSFGTLIVVIMSQTWLNSNLVDKLTSEQIVTNNSSTRPLINMSTYAGEFYMLVMSTLLGMFIMVSSGNFLLFFLGLETASVPMACLVAFDRLKKQSAEGAAKYILTATFSSGVMLYGISFIYGACGSLYFDDVADALTTSLLFDDTLLLPVMGLVFFFSGLGFKLSLVPFHFWTADTYQGAPTPVTGYLSVVSKGAAALALFIILTKTFAPLFEYWQMLMAIVIVLTITVGNLFAIRQSELKRFMAFSSISQAGYIMLAVMGDSSFGGAALTYYVLVYVVANMAVFTVISAVEQASVQHPDSTLNTQRSLFNVYNGFYETNPRLAFLMTLALFSLAGIPPFAGMFSKFFVFMAAAGEGSFLAYLVVFVALINTVVSLYYYLLIVKAMYIKKTTTPLPYFRSDTTTRLALALCTTGIAAFGIVSCIYEWIAAAAA